MKRYSVTFFGLLVSILVTPVFLQGASFTDPEIPDGQTLHYRYTTGEYKNKYLLEVKQREEVVESTNRITYKYNEKGEKIYRIHDRGIRRNGDRFEHISNVVVRNDILFPVDLKQK